MSPVTNTKPTNPARNIARPMGTLKNMSVSNAGKDNTPIRVLLNGSILLPLAIDHAC